LCCNTPEQALRLGKPIILQDVQVTRHVWSGVIIWWRKHAARERRDIVAAERRQGIAPRPTGQSAE
jgi:hypothetical protein